MHLFILLVFCFQAIRSTFGYLCVDQPRTPTMLENGSLIIPCTYTDDGDEEYRVSWDESDGPYCDNMEEIIDWNGNVKDKYKGRIFRIQDPSNKRKESIIIHGRNILDKLIICCKVTYVRSGQNYYTSDYGTSVHFTGDNSVSQPDELIAVPGEEVTIPCHYPQEIAGDVQRVVWYREDRIECDTEIYVSDRNYSINFYSLVNFPTEGSLHIDKVTPSDGFFYCCSVTTATGQLKRKRTQLLIADPRSFSPLFTVKQLNNITADTGGSVTLNCSYSHTSHYRDRDVLGVNVYWRVNSTSGPYAYHPYPEMVHPSYKGRTRIEGLADLHIQGVLREYNTSYYCFLMITFCQGTKSTQKIIAHGDGTRLIIKEESLKTNTQQLLLIASISASLIVVLLCIILMVLMIRGIICKNKKSISGLHMNAIDDPDKDNRMHEELPYCEIGGKSPEVDLAGENKEESEDVEVNRCLIDAEKEENLTYAQLNKTKLKQRTATPIQEEMVVYSTVLNPASPHRGES